MPILNLYNELNSFLILGALLFGMGVYGMLTRRTFIGMLIAAELILAGSSINFMAFNRFNAPGQVFTLFIMAIAAAEAAIGLSIVIAVYKQFKSIDAEDTAQLKG